MDSLGRPGFNPACDHAPNQILLALGASSYLSMGSAVHHRPAASVQQKRNTLLCEAFVAALAIFGQNTLWI